LSQTPETSAFTLGLRQSQDLAIEYHEKYVRVVFMTIEIDASSAILGEDTPEDLINRMTDFGEGEFWLFSQREADTAIANWSNDGQV